MSFALIKRLPVEPKIDFLGQRKLFAVFSALLFLGAIALFLVQMVLAWLAPMPQRKTGGAVVPTVPRPASA